MKKFHAALAALIVGALLPSGAVADGASVAHHSHHRGLRHRHSHKRAKEVSSSEQSPSAIREHSAQIHVEGSSQLDSMYTHADEVAQFIERRRGSWFVPEGMKPDVDLTSDEVRGLELALEEKPDIFEHCLLIRDFAEPLRVGSALISSGRRAQLVTRAAKKPAVKALGGRRNATKAAGGNATKVVDGAGPAAARRGLGRPTTAVRGAAPSSLVQLGRRARSRRGDLTEDVDQDSDAGAEEEESSDSTVDGEEDDDDEDGDDDDDDDQLPDSVLLAKGGVVDRDQVDEGKHMEAIMEVSAVAYLDSVAGQVSVVANGAVAKWSSKKKVPIAGYLCTDSGKPILHTLPTPCVASILTDEGTNREPPAAAGGAAPAPAPGGDRDDEPSGFQAPSAAPSASPAPAKPKADPGRGYAVFVGSAKLHFSSRAKAEEFCSLLAEQIAEDPSDNVWDTDHVKHMKDEVDPDMTSFVQLVRKDPPIKWTTGTKKVLVVVMDWKAGDESKSPFTKQTLTPAHYENRIFPRVREAFRTMSYGKFDIEVTVVPEVIRYTKPRSRYTSQGFPFPGLYNGATESLAGNARFGSRYDVADYDLVYTISPQQNPTGTKGVAWVGAKGAMCNGCETISENFQVMVAVHELGHNLGLSHAGSKSLEYGNPFDWMGNYPDVIGLSYGMGYKLRLHWLPRESVPLINDQSVKGLAARFVLKPFDGTEPQQGQLVGVQLSMSRNPRDIYFAYRATAGAEAGIYVVLQDKSKPDSELIDMGCHTPSQKDARLQPGWTFIDPSSSVVVKVESVTESAASLLIYEAPGSQDLASIRARPKFSDGTYKCPRTCTDSDLLVANFDGCAKLAGQGYCKGGMITMGGTKYAIGKDLCPRACDFCADVLSGSPMLGGGAGGGCGDKNVKINGMKCPVIARKGFCDANTNIGNVGRDLCPKSCGNCPPKPSFDSSASADLFQDPKPTKTYGSGKDFAPAPAPPPSPPPPPPATGGAANTPRPCEDDATWTDKDGDGCAVYARYIEEGKLKRSVACEYGGSEAKRACPMTCDSCPVQDLRSSNVEETCLDQPCVTAWQQETGQCFPCADWPSRCSEPAMQADCPVTCNLCGDRPLAVTNPPPPVRQEGEARKNETIAECVDQECVVGWKNLGGCVRCEDYAEDYCGSDPVFMESCPVSCKLCVPREPVMECSDDFQATACTEYKGNGWCNQAEISKHCRLTCGVCNVSDAHFGPMFPGANQIKRPAPARGAAAGRGSGLVAALAIILAAALSAAPAQ